MYNYSIKEYDKEHMARGVGINLPISTKMSVEICHNLRGKELTMAKKVLSKIIDVSEAIPIRRYKMELAHKRKIGPGRYPVKASKEILNLIESVESNAQFKGLNTSELIIYHINAQKGANSTHYGRLGRNMKRTTIEVVLKEKPKKEMDKKPVKAKNMGAKRLNLANQKRRVT